MVEVRDTSAGQSADVDIVALRAGDKIGRYEVRAVLGQGGFGITYRAHDLQLDREVAIKEYLPTSLAWRQDGATVVPRSTKVAEDFTWGRDRFVSEGRTLASLHNAPAIVRVFDFLEINGTAYIVMELVQGETLEARLKQKGKLGPDEVDAILSPMLDGLEKVHAAGFLHRDIKPANILLSAEGRPTLIDFGASRAAMAGRTTAMTAIFTPGYAAAEQMTSAKQGPWTDIYGLSATLYHAITGAAPPSAFDRMLDDTYQPVTKLAPPQILGGFKPGLLVGLDAGLAVRASDRPQSIAGWRPLLAQADLAGADATVALARTPAPARPSPVEAAPAPSPTVPSAPATKSRMPIYAGAAAAVLLLLAGGGWFLFGGKPGPQAPAPQMVALQDLKVEELEKVLEARRKAEAEAEEKRRAEEEARQKAEADSAAKRAADEELAKAEEQRRKAEEQLAKLQAELEASRKAAAEQRGIAEAAAKRAAAEEARRKAEAEMAALRAAEEEARRKAAIEAEAKKLADEALAKAAAERAKAEAEAKAKAETEAKQKAEADAKTRAEAEARAREQEKKEKAEAEVKAKEEAAAKGKLEGDKKSAEAAETALRLTTVDRQRLQVALTALGHNTGGSDGAFGPRTRQMIASWQKKRSEPETGFLTAAQQQALLKDAAPAITKFDDEQKKLEEDKKKAEEEAKAKAASAAQAPPQQAAPPPSGGLPNGPFAGALNLSAPGGVDVAMHVSITLANGRGAGTATSTTRCGNRPISLSVDASGAVKGTMTMCNDTPGSVSGRYQGGTLVLNISGISWSGRGTLSPGGGGAAPAAVAPSQPAAAAAAPPAGGLPSGTFSGGLSMHVPGGGDTLVQASVTLANGHGSGTGNVAGGRCSSVSFSIVVDAGGTVTGTAAMCDGTAGTITGRYQGGRLNLNVAGAAATIRGTLSPGGRAVAPAAAAPPAAAPPQTATVAPSAVADGRYSGTMDFYNPSGGGVLAAVTVTMANGTGTGTVNNKTCGDLPISLKVDAAGRVSGDLKYTYSKSCGTGIGGRVTGRADGNRLVLEMNGTQENVKARFTLLKQ